MSTEWAATATTADKPAVPALERELTTLWRWNLGCGLLHLVQGIGVLVASQVASNVKNFKLPITSDFLVWSSAGPRQNPAILGFLPFAATASGFAFLSAAAHFLVLLCWGKYTADLARGLNRFRWWEYALSSSLMIVLIAMLFGVWNVISLVGVGAINTAMCLFGDLHEVMNAGRAPAEVDWTAYIYGTAAGLVPWGIIIAFIAATPNLQQVPAFVWAILVVYFILFQSFPLVMFMQYKRIGCCRNTGRIPELGDAVGYYTGERAYQTLSLVAKSLLLWLVVGGVNQPNSYSN